MGGPGSCVVWWADLSAEAAWHGQLLDDGERDRRHRLVREADRSRLTLAAALLRLAVATEVSPDQVGLAAAAIRVDRRCPTCLRPHGRPTLPDYPQLHVSVSHSAHRVAIAVTTAGPVGVDVEEVSAVDTAILVPSVLASGERSARADPLSLTEFFTYWTRKEAVLKATGDGLRVAMADVRVTPPGQSPRLLAYPGLAGATVQMCDLQPGDGYKGSLAVLCTAPITVAERDGAELLSRP